MHTLTAEQKQSLLDLINEEFGSHLGFDEFADTMLGLFENIPGFETISPAKPTRLVNQLWSKYCGQETKNA